MDESFENWMKERASETDADDGRLSPGTVIGAYRVETFLGKGGFAEVYGAKTATGERVAIKILHRLDEQSRMRFERESNILSQIHHPNIPKLLSFGSCGNRPYLVMEMLEAKELPHSDKAVASFIKAVCRAADALHKMGYVHRDIKPSNVLWRGSTPVLIDFGLACLKTNVPRSPSTISIVDGQRIVVGTMGYAAPEQFAGGRIDEATDVHAIGMLADACFNGHPPRCWRKIIDRATNSRNSARYVTAVELYRAVSIRHFGHWLLLALSGFAFVYNLFVSHLCFSSLMYGIGAGYENGWFGPTNAVRAATWYIRAANADTDFWDGGLSLLEAGDCYAFGFGVPEDIFAAYDMYEKAAAKCRTAEAINKVRMARIQVKNAINRKHEKLRKEVAKSEKRAMLSDMTHLAWQYRYGVGVKCDPQMEFTCSKEAADMGSDQGIADFAVCYEEGRGCKKDEKKAAELFKKAAMMGNGWASCRYGRCLAEGRGVEKNPIKAFEWFKRGADGGCEWGILQVAKCYLAGFGVKRDAEKARDWLRKLENIADRGGNMSLDAVHMLCEIYMTGHHGRGCDPSRAFKYCKLAEKADVGWGIKMLGECYEKGIGTAVDKEKAVECYERARRKCRSGDWETKQLDARIRTLKQ